MKKNRIALIVTAVSLAACAPAGTVGTGTGQDALKSSVERRVEAAVRGDNSPFMHAMRSRNEGAEEARSKINAWIRFNLMRAFAYKARGEMEPALFHFCMARHALRDSVSSFANDERGDPAVLAGNLPDVHRSGSSGGWRDKIDEDTQSMFDNSSVPEGDLLRMYGIDSARGPIDRPNQAPRPRLAPR